MSRTVAYTRASAQITGQFADVGASTAYELPVGQVLGIDLVTPSGTFAGSIVLERTTDGGRTYATEKSYTADIAGDTIQSKGGTYRLRCVTYTGDPINYTISVWPRIIREYQNAQGQVVLRITDNGIEVVGTILRDDRVFIMPAGVHAKVGATSGWVVGAADNLSLATCPAGKTASTLVVPVAGLKLGNVITAFNLVGQIESGGNVATVDVQLRKLTAAAADVVDSLVASMTQLSVTADTAMTSANTSKSGLSETVVEGAVYYLLITVTTAAATDIALQAAEITASEI